MVTTTLAFCTVNVSHRTVRKVRKCKGFCCNNKATIYKATAVRHSCFPADNRGLQKNDVRGKWGEEEEKRGQEKLEYGGG